MQIKETVARIRFFIKKYKYSLVISIVIISTSLLLAFTGETRENKHIDINDNTNTLDIYHCNRELYATAPIESTRELKDDNDLQLLHAQANGLKYIYMSNEEFERDSAKLAATSLLVRIKDNPLYRIKPLTHSYPYVTPEMAALLNDIGWLFQKKMKARKKDNYCMLVTSALRTGESQSSLSRRNRNATEQSTHVYGTTVDITYKDYYNTKTNTVEQNATAAEALRETMIELRKQCRLVIVRERRQSCYHFTVVNCDLQRSPSDSISTQQFYNYY